MTPRALAAAAAALCLAASASPAGASFTSALDENAAWLLASLGLDAVPDGDSMVYVGDTAYRTSTAEALRTTAARAGDVRLAALAASAGGDGAPYGVGDLWLIELGPGDGCSGMRYLAPSPLPYSGLHEQLHTYGYALGTGESLGGEHARGYVVDWSTKGSTGGEYRARSAVFGGSTDLYCVHLGFAYYLLFPVIDGFACVAGSPCDLRSGA